MSKWGKDIGRAALDEARSRIGNDRPTMTRPKRTTDAGRDWFEANQASITRNLGEFRLDKS